MLPRLHGMLRSSLKLFTLLVCAFVHGQPEMPLEHGESQGNDEITALFKYRVWQVDSVSQTHGLSNRFASIYKASMSNINVQLLGMDSGAQDFIRRFEISFIGYFLEAATEFEKKGKLHPDAVWNCYFSNPRARPWQSTLVGINAHVNGDIWKGLVQNFKEGEIRRYKKNLLDFQSSISKAFQPLFDNIMSESAYLRFINSFTKGSAKLYGEWLIYTWRVRQINLAILYFENPEKFKKRLRVVNRKRHKIDRAILRKK